MTNKKFQPGRHLILSKNSNVKSTRVTSASSFYRINVILACFTLASSARYSMGRRSASSTANKTPKPFLPPLTPQTGAGGDSAYEPESIFDTNRKQSVVLLASALSTGTKYDKEDITYSPGRWWVRLKSTDDLLKERQILRSQHTWEYDFPKTFKMPFPKHIEEKAKINDV